jgi:hypothetical protein
MIDFPRPVESRNDSTLKTRLFEFAFLAEGKTLSGAREIAADAINKNGTDLALQIVQYCTVIGP